MQLVKDNYKPEQPVSAVGSDWFNAVAKFVNKLTGAKGISIDRSGEFPKVQLVPPASAPTADKALTWKANAHGPSWENAHSTEQPTTVDDHSTESEGSGDETTGGQAWSTWTAGGANGFKMRVYTTAYYYNGAHYLESAILTFNKYGQLVTVTKGDTRKEVQA